MIEDLYRAAWHEAGHAIAAYRYGRPIRLVTADTKGEGGTFCHALQPGARSRFRGRVWSELVKQEICICLAGPIAEEIKHGAAEDSVKIDIQMARRWLGEIMVQEALGLAMLTARTRKLLTEPQTWNAVGDVARRLIQGRKIRGTDVNTICHSHQVQRDGICINRRTRVSGRLVRYGIRRYCESGETSDQELLGDPCEGVRE